MKLWKASTNENLFTILTDDNRIFELLYTGHLPKIRLTTNYRGKGLNTFTPVGSILIRGGIPKFLKRTVFSLNAKPAEIDLLNQKPLHIFEYQNK